MYNAGKFSGSDTKYSEERVRTWVIPCGVSYLWTTIPPIGVKRLLFSRPRLKISAINKTLTSDSFSSLPGVKEPRLPPPPPPLPPGGFNSYRENYRLNFDVFLSTFIRIKHSTIIQVNNNFISVNMHIILKYLINIHFTPIISTLI